jgi:hypothetical protein
VNELLASGLNLDPYPRGAGIERIFQQFLGNRGRALHDFAGGDLVGNVFGENVDSAHVDGVVEPSQFRRWRAEEAKHEQSRRDSVADD